MWDFMIAGLPRREFTPFPLNKKTPEIVIFQLTALKSNCSIRNVALPMNQDSLLQRKKHGASVTRYGASGYMKNTHTMDFVQRCVTQIRRAIKSLQQTID